MKNFYYVVEYQHENIDGVLECNGLKNVTIYTISNNVPKKITELELELESKTTDEISEYLIENGLGDDNINLIQL